MKLFLKWLPIGIKNVFKFKKVLKIFKLRPFDIFYALESRYQFEFDMPVLM